MRRRLKRGVADGGASHLNIGYVSGNGQQVFKSCDRLICFVLVEEGFEDDDFVALFEEAHECA